MDENQIPMAEEPQGSSFPWSALDCWIGVGLLALVNVALLVFITQFPDLELMQNAGIVFLQLASLLPVVLIFAWKKIPWKHIRFTKFDSATMGLGCDLVIAAYGIAAVHNLILVALGVDTQGAQILEIFSELDSPIWFFIVGVIVAPLVEEIFFRGFLFQGFRQRYGWIAGLVLSSFIFAAAHLGPVAFIPTFLLGAVMAYVYHRSNSILPGVVLHFLVNGFGLCAAYAATQIPGIIPA